MTNYSSKELMKVIFLLFALSHARLFGSYLMCISNYYLCQMWKPKKGRKKTALKAKKTTEKAKKAKPAAKSEDRRLSQGSTHSQHTPKKSQSQ